MTPFAIAGIQQYVSALHENVTRMRQRLDVVMHLYPWVQMVVWSELAPMGPFLQHAKELPSDEEDAFREMAERHQIWLLPGSMYERRADGKIYNTASVINPRGEVVARHRKLFPFMPYEQGVTPGSEFVVFDVPEVGRFGVSICYDMWFPETSRSLVALGAEVILHPTLTPTIDRRIELAIAESTAAINQCFIIDVNGLGDGGNGRSVFVGPAGDVLYQAGSAEVVIPLEIDLDRVRRSRENGVRGLGQPLKSFRDSDLDFSVYDRERRPKFLESLGPLSKPARGSRAGLAPLAISQMPPPDLAPPDEPADLPEQVAPTE